VTDPRQKKLQAVFEALRSHPEGRKLALEEMARKKRIDLALDPDKLLFGPQADFVKDPARLKAASCSRRAGKSFSLAYEFFDAAFTYPHSTSVYITKTRELGKDIMWPAFQVLAELIEVELNFHRNTGDVYFPNGSSVKIRGVDDERQMEKLRGPKYPVVAIDEAQAFPRYLKTLIEDVAEPATLDYQGKILITGTPNAACRGVFYDIVHDQNEMHGWSVHGWTLRDNPHLPDVEEWLAQKRRQKRWTPQTPTYLREYCGKWVRDSDGLVYALSHEFVLEKELPRGEDWVYVLGVDIGWRDPTAFVVVAYSELRGQAYVVHCEKHQELSHARIAVTAQELYEDYDIDVIVVDAAEPAVIDLMSEKYGMPAIPAKKREKVAYIDMLNTDLRTGQLKILENCYELIDEMELLQWDEKSIDYGKPKEDKRFANHATDAMLYAWRYCYHNSGEWDRALPDPGTPEYYQKMTEEMERDLAKELGSDYRDDWETSWWANL
jgi:hypothetical protein